MLKKILLIIACCCLSSKHTDAQVITDSLANDFRTFVSVNFSRFRTVNAFWETQLNHDYIFTLDGKDVEKGRKKNLHTFKFSTMIPIVKSKRLSLYANMQYDRYQFDTENKLNHAPSAVFAQNHYDYFAGGLNGSYYMSLFRKPFVISASVTADAWNKGWGMLMGTASGVMVFKNTAWTTFSAGIMLMTHFSSIPIMPILTYWHRFKNPNLSADITFPSQFYLRYQMKKQRISLGAFMSSDNFYLKTNLEGAPRISYYCDAVLKPEIHYEYIINKHIYLSAHAGLSMVMTGGLYKKNRKGIRVNNEDGNSEVEPVVKQDRSPIPFFNVGISYSLFK